MLVFTNFLDTRLLSSKRSKPDFALVGKSVCVTDGDVRRRRFDES